MNTFAHLCWLTWVIYEIAIEVFILIEWLFAIQYIIDLFEQFQLFWFTRIIQMNAFDWLESFVIFHLKYLYLLSDYLPYNRLDLFNAFEYSHHLISF